MSEYSFCESVYATGTSAWHIRKLTEAGQKFGGGIDTPFLCGMRSRGWDVRVEMTKRHLENNACKKCLEAYKQEKAP